MAEAITISSQLNECMDWSLEKIEQSIVSSSYDMARSMLEIGPALKVIADGKKYSERGYTSFKEYMEDASAHNFPFSYSQACKHIRVYERFGNRLSELNCAKIEVLDVLRDIPEEDFEKLNDSGELSILSKREAEKLKAEIKAANEQISLLSAEKDKITADCNSFKAERDEYYEQMKGLESRPVETVIAEPSEELLRSIREEAAKEAEKNMVSAKSEYEKAIKELKKEKKAAESRVKEIEEAHKKELDDMSASLGADKAATDERIKELERKLQSAEKPADAELIEFKFYFSETQESLKKMISALNNVSDPEKKQKFKGAAVKFVSAILSDLEPDERS